MTVEEYLIARKSKDWNFNQIVDGNSFLNVRKIHPIKQKIVKEIVDDAKCDEYIKRIIIFGSAIRYDCDITSDLDICIEWKEECYDEDGVLKKFTRNIRKTISEVTKGRADVLNYGYLEGTEVEESVKEGVIVYEYNV